LVPEDAFAAVEDPASALEDAFAVPKDAFSVFEDTFAASEELSLFPPFQAPHATGKEPGGKTRHPFFDHLLSAKFLKLFPASGKGKTTVLVAITTVESTFGTIGVGSPTLGIFAKRHSATLTKFIIFHHINNL
jgi:hypothetical protein